MSTTFSTPSLAKESYYHLLEGSYLRATRILTDMEKNPNHYAPEKKQETTAYLSRLQQDMGRFHK